MSLEMIGPRILAPYLGVSSFTWMSMISVILLALSIGYYIGGLLYFRFTKTSQLLSYLLLFSSLSLWGLNVLKHPILQKLQSLSFSSSTHTLIACFLLFLLPGLFLSMASVICTQELIKNQQDKKLGFSFGISTLGALLGIFATHLYLIPWIGTEKILFVLSAVLTLGFLWIVLKNVLPFIFMLALNAYSYYQFAKTKNIIDIDSVNQRIFVYKDIDHKTKDSILVMQLNGSVNGAVFLHKPDLVYEYNQAMFDIIVAKKQKQKILFLGGGAFSLPSFVQRTFPNLQVDVVEIDEVLYPLAKQNFKASEDIHVFTQDARVFLQQSAQKYDVIIWDVFTSIHNLPDHLLTQETAQQLVQKLKPGGLVVANILSSSGKQHKHLLSSALQTYQSVFNSALVCGVQDPAKTEYFNALLLASNYPKDSLHALLDSLPKHYPIPMENSVILTDDFSPFSFRVGR